MGRTEIRAYLAWTRLAGPFWQYVAATPFYGPTPPRPTPLPLAAGRSLAEQTILPFFHSVSGRVALLLDLPIDVGLAMTDAFLEASWLVVPVVFRWPAPAAILPTESVLSQLVALSGRLRSPASPRGVVFILDGDRQGPGVAVDLTRRFDNRYRYPADALPPASLLRAWDVEALSLAAHYLQLPVDVAAITGLLAGSGLALSRVWVPPSPEAAER